MDEFELRVAAHELALIEVIAFTGAEAIRQGSAAIREGMLPGIGANGRVTCAQTVQLLEDALHHYAAPGVGISITGTARGSSK